MLRLFTGLEIPSDLAADLFSLRGGLVGARWTDIDDYHITLCFIGDIDAAAAREVAHELARIRRSPFTVTLDELTTFGGDRPRAVIARAQPAHALVELQAEHERLLRRIRIRPEPRKFTPHVTLARLRSASVAAVADYLETRGFFPARKFVVNRFVLFSSRTSVGGGPYVVEAAYPLS